MKVKIFGQKRVGTNLVENLLRQCGVEVQVNQPWKHGPATWRGHQAEKIVIVSKNPFAWYWSNINYKHPAGELVWDIDGYVERENQYAEFNAIESGCLWLRYEDLIGGLGLMQLAGFVGAKTLPEIPHGKMDRAGNTTSQQFNAATYQRHEYYEDIPSATRDRIRAACAESIVPFNYPELRTFGWL